MSNQLILACIVLFIVIKLITLIYVSRGKYSSKFVTYWTIFPTNLDNIDHLSKEQQVKFNFLIYLSGSLDVLIYLVIVGLIFERKTDDLILLLLLTHLSSYLFSIPLNKILEDHPLENITKGDGK